MTKAILYVLVCVITLATGAVFAQTGTASGPVGGNTPAVPATPATPAAPATPATPAVPATPATPAEPATPVTPSSAPDAAVEGDVKTRFDEADANADGKITRDEARTNLTLNARFRSIDRNKDGTLSLDEYKAADSRKGKSKS